MVIDFCYVIIIIIIINLEIYLVDFPPTRLPLPTYYKFNRSRIRIISKTHNILLSFPNQWPQFPVRRHDYHCRRYSSSPLCRAVTIIFFPMVQQPLVGQALLMIEDLHSHSDTPQAVGLLWKIDRPDAKTSTFQYKTQEIDIYAPGGISTHSFSKRAATGIGVYTYVCVCVYIYIYTVYETNHISRVYSFGENLYLHFMLYVMLFLMLNVLHFYISTFRSVCIVPSGYYYYYYYYYYTM